MEKEADVGWDLGIFGQTRGADEGAVLVEKLGSQHLEAIGAKIVDGA